jgi:hypothetical protein
MRTSARALRTLVLVLAALTSTALALTRESGAAEPAKETERPAPASPGPSALPVASAPAPAPAPGPPELPLYVPPDLGTPERRVGAGTRGVGTGSVQILAPDHLAKTSEAQPTFYWYLAEPTATRIDFTLRDERAVEPLLEVTLPGPAGAGIHAVRLADYGVTLAPGGRYRWFVALVPEPAERSKDFASGAWVERVEPSASLRESARGDGAAFAYAEAGFWYEALDAVSREIARAPRDASLRLQRAALLDQVKLPEPAAFDRGAATH